MSEDSRKQQTLYQYFLGMLSEAEQAQLEEEYFAQPERRQALWATFDELVERFVQGEMTAQEAQAFAFQLQTKPALRARAERLHTLYHFLSATSRPNEVKEPLAPAQATPRRQSWGALPIWGWGVLVTGVLLLGLGGWWLSRRANPQEQEVAQVQPTVASTVPPVNTPLPAPTITSPNKGKSDPQPARLKPFYLLLEEVRAPGEATKLAITEQTQTIVLYFEMPPPLRANYQGVAQIGKGQIFASFPRLPVQELRGTTFVAVRLTVADIPPADFTIQLKASSAEKEAPPLVTRRFRLAKE